MALMQSYENGQPCWVDLGTPDVVAAADFYTKLLGWQVEIGPAEMGHYSMAMIDGQPVGALADQQTPGMVVWSIYLAVDDVDATVARAKAAGGAVIMEPADVMTFGRMAIVADPGGAFISFWQAGEHKGAGLMGDPGSVVWVELMTRAIDESVAFYEAVVGLTAAKQDLEGHDYYEFKTASGQTVGGLMPMVGDMWPPDIPNHWMVYFAVPDTDAAAAKAAELGGSAPVPPTDIPPGRFAVLNDPQGGFFSVLALRPDFHM